MRTRALIAAAAACLALGAGSAAAMPARAGAPRARSANSGCAEQGTSTLYKLTRARVRAFKRRFRRSHHGYKIVAIGTSVFAPPHYVGLYWLKPGAPGGSYAAGGVTFYCNGRLIRHPVHNALVGFDVTSLWVIESSGSGSYSDVKTVTDPSPDGDTTTSTTTVNFSWDDLYGTQKHPASITVDADQQPIAGDLPGDALKASLTGTGTFQYTDAAEPDLNYTCTYTVSGMGDPTFDWNRIAHPPGLRFFESLPGASTTDVSETGDTEGTCDDQAPGVSYSFDYSLLPPGKPSGGAALWKPFSVSPGFDHPSHSSTTDPDSGLIYTEDKDLKVSGGILFKLDGVGPPA